MTEWAVSQGLTDYNQAAAAMERRVEAIASGQADELVWLLQHPPLYTAGASAKPADLIDPGRFPVFEARRGGQFTYHGPGQRVAYLMLDLSRRGRDVRSFVDSLEGWLIDALAALDVVGERRAGRVGVWVDLTKTGGSVREAKIAAIGVRIRRWVSFHGVSLNVDPDLSHFSGIAPCGVVDPGLGVTSLAALGRAVSLDAADQALKNAFQARLGPVADAAPPLSGPA